LVEECPVLVKVPGIISKKTYQMKTI